MNAEQLLNLSENIYHLYSHVMDGLIEEDSQIQREGLVELAESLMSALLISQTVHTNKIDEEIDSYMFEDVNLDGEYEDEISIKVLDENNLDGYEDGEFLSLETVFSPYDGIVININKSGVTIIQDDFTHEIKLDAINPELKVSDVIEKDQVIGYRILK